MPNWTSNLGLVNREALASDQTYVLQYQLVIPPSAATLEFSTNKLYDKLTGDVCWNGFEIEHCSNDATRTGAVSTISGHNACCFNINTSSQTPLTNTARSFSSSSFEYPIKAELERSRT